MQVLKFLNDLLFKENLTCLLCGREVFYGENFCQGCQSGLIKIDGANSCAKCGRYSPNDRPYCQECKSFPYEFKKAKSVYNFDKDIQKLILKYKDGGEVYLSDFFTAKMLPIYRTHFLKTDIIVAVPPSLKSLKRRGFDHTLKIAEKITESTGAKLVVGGVIKVSDFTQKKLDKKTRFLLAQKAFRVTKRTLFKDKEVLIIDDVLTTGATVHAIAKKINKAGAKGVSVLTFASVCKNVGQI